jgi:hypothetical protein
MPFVKTKNSRRQSTKNQQEQQCDASQHNGHHPFKSILHKEKNRKRRFGKSVKPTRRERRSNRRLRSAKNHLPNRIHLPRKEQWQAKKNQNNHPNITVHGTPLSLLKRPFPSFGLCGTAIASKREKYRPNSLLVKEHSNFTIPLPVCQFRQTSFILRLFDLVRVLC